MTRKAAPGSLATTISGAIAAVTGEVGAIRSQVEEIKAELEIERARPVPPKVVSARIDETIAAMRQNAAARISVGELLRADGRGMTGALTLTKTPPFAVAALVAPEGLRAWLAEQVAEVTGRLPEPATSEQRAARLAELERRLFQVERREAQLLWEATEAGMQIPWRPDIDPLAVLGLSE